MHSQAPYSADLMVVDDTPGNLRLLLEILTEQGHQVRPMIDGELAIAAAQQSPPDLILLDIKMPKLDGYEICHHLKTDERTRDVPIIFLTVLDDTIDKVKGFELGAVDYISKPFETAELLARIHNQLKIRSLQKILFQKNQTLQQEVIHRQKTEADLKASEQKFSKIFQSSPQPITLISLENHCYVDANQAFLSQSGFELSEILGKTPVELNLWVNLEERAQLFKVLKQQGHVHQFETRLRTKVGKVITVVLFLEIVVLENLPYLLSTGEDITTRKLAEQKLAFQTKELSQTLKKLRETQDELIQSAKMAALGNLVAGVAHEINTPVGNAILTASTLSSETRILRQELENQALNSSKTQAYFDIAEECSQLILSNLQRAGELIQSFKRVAVDQTSLQIRSFQLNSYLEEILLNLSPKIKQTPHKIFLEGSKRTTLKNYPGALAQVITNLIFNSIAHAYPEGEAGSIYIAWKQEKDQVRIEYKDDGCGIVQENQHKVFEPFFSTSAHGEGSGLGLHVVYNLVTQKMGGKITMASDSRSGTMFTMIFPVEPPFAR